MKTRIIGAGLATMTLIGIGVLVPAHASPAADLVSGVVTDTTGRPVRNVDVTLIAWPSLEQRQAQEIGQDLPLTVVDSTRTDENGNYVFLSPAATAIVNNVSGNGVVDFTVMAAETPAEPGSSREGEFDFSRAVDGPMSVVRAEVSSTAKSSSNLPGLLHFHKPGGAGMGVVHANLALSPVSSRARTAAQQKVANSSSFKIAAEASTIRAFDVSPAAPCVENLTDEWDKYARVGANYSRMPGSKVQFDYSKGATTTVDVAAAPVGGPFAISGSASFSDSVAGTVHYLPQTGAVSVVHDTQILQGMYTYSCTGPGGGGKRETKPVAWKGGNDHNPVVDAPGRQPEKNCSHYAQGANSGADIDTSKASSFALGVQMPDLGINLSTQTGYNSSTSLSFRFPGGAGWICGTNGTPFQNNAGKILASKQTQ